MPKSSKKSRTPRPKKKAAAASRQRSQRLTAIKNMVTDVQQRVHHEAQGILGNALWPLDRFAEVPQAIFGLFWYVFDAYRERIQHEQESMWNQMRELAKAQTATDFNLAVLERLAYDDHGKEKIAALWLEVHAVCGVCNGLAALLNEQECLELRHEVLGEELPAKEQPEASSEIPAAVLAAANEGQIETGEYEARPHPEGATVFGGDQ
jgi:hypothetical protein